MAELALCYLPVGPDELIELGAAMELVQGSDWAAAVVRPFVAGVIVGNIAVV
jgi:hypothetical protein